MQYALYNIHILLKVSTYAFIYVCIYIVVCNRMIFCGIVLLLAIVLLRAYCLHNDAYWLTETQPRKNVLQNLEKNLS